MLALLVTAALAQPVTAVPPGATAVTVLVCADAATCDAQMQAYGAHATRLRIPVIPFDRVAGAALADADALAAFDAALRAGDASEAWAALSGLEYTVTPDDLLGVLLGLGEARLAAGDLAGADRAFARAASSSDRRVHDLRPLSGDGPSEDGLSEDGLSRYLDAVAALGDDARIRVEGRGATVFLDGVEVGPAPRAMAAAPGWHRVSVEQVGRRTAWVGAVDLRPGDSVTLRPRLDLDDRGPGLRAAVLGELEGVSAPADATERLAGWARGSGLRHVRFVTLARQADDAEEQIEGWAVRSVTLDVAAARFTRDGPGPAALRIAADRERFRVGAAVGWLHLGPREHVTADLVLNVRVTPLFSADVRVGVAHSGTPYNLYPTWIDRQVYPVSVGGRIGGTGPGFYGVASALVVAPHAVGGIGGVGYDLAPGPAQRLSIEARGGLTDVGAVIGVGLVAVGRR